MSDLGLPPEEERTDWEEGHWLDRWLYESPHYRAKLVWGSIIGALCLVWLVTICAGLGSGMFTP